MSLNVLVTGGAGYIGSHAVLALRDAGYEVTVLDSLVTGFRHAVPEGVPLVEADIADHGAVAQVIADRGIGAILHFAASLLVEESVRDPLKYWRNNVGGTTALLEAAVAGGVRHFVFSSTAATYGMPETMPVPEDAPTRPINPYGRSKLAVEGLLGDVSAAFPLNHAVLRYFNVAGADPQGRAGQNNSNATHLIHVASEAATGRRERVSIFGVDYPTPDGTCIRDYIHVTDLAEAHVLALDALVDAPTENLRLNVGYGRGFSVREILDAVDRVAGAPVLRVEAARRPGDPPQLVANADAIRARLGWTPRHGDLDGIVRTALDWERNRT